MIPDKFSSETSRWDTKREYNLLQEYYNLKVELVSACGVCIQVQYISANPQLCTWSSLYPAVRVQTGSRSAWQYLSRLMASFE
jgi:hypothetical protein